MPVDNGGTFFPQPNVQFESPDGPEKVEIDDGTTHTGVVEPESSPVTVDHSEMHQADSTDQFESPGPETVRLEGFDGPEQVAEIEPAEAAESAPGAEPDGSPTPAELEPPKEDTVQPSPDADPAAEPAGRHEAPAADSKLISSASVQKKVVEPAPAQPATGTPGVEVK